MTQHCAQAMHVRNDASLFLVSFLTLSKELGWLQAEAKDNTFGQNDGQAADP